MTEIPDKIKGKIEQLQLLEQKMQNFLAQKQHIQTQLVEIDSALEELEKSKTAYKIVGNIMVSSNKDDLEKDLKQKKEMMGLRLKALEKQEENSKTHAKKLQEEVLGDMNN